MTKRRAAIRRPATTRATRATNQMAANTPSVISRSRSISSKSRTPRAVSSTREEGHVRDRGRTVRVAEDGTRTSYLIATLVMRIRVIPESRLSKRLDEAVGRAVSNRVAQAAQLGSAEISVSSTIRSTTC